MPKTHDLKCVQSSFDAIERGDKLFEIRDERDRDFEVGDRLLLRCFDLERDMYIAADGRIAVFNDAALLRCTVTHVERGRWGLPVGLCVMGIRVEKENG